MSVQRVWERKRRIPSFRLHRVAVLVVTAVAHCDHFATAWKNEFNFLKRGAKHESGNGYRQSQQKSPFLSLRRGGETGVDSLDDRSYGDISSDCYRQSVIYEALGDLLDLETLLHGKYRPQRDDDRGPATNRAQQSPYRSTARRPRRKSSDVILDLASLSGLELSPKSLQLRVLFLERKHEFLKDLQISKHDAKKKRPKPSRLLQVLAPKIPALKQSPDISLRIVSAQSDLDPGLAACLIATLAHVCEVIGGNDDNNNTIRCARELLLERQFEQLVECLVCGLDVPKLTKDYAKLLLDADRVEPGNRDIFHVLTKMAGTENSNYDEGLSVGDCCRAAWGLAVLGAHRQEIFSENIRVSDLLQALSLHVREVLLRRMQLMCQEDALLSFSDDNDAADTIEKRLLHASEGIAGDAAAALWAFGCVRALTGIRSNALFQMCCSILCQNPIELRHRAQMEYVPTSTSTISIGSNDVVEKLARLDSDSDAIQVVVANPRNVNGTDENAEGMSISPGSTSSSSLTTAGGTGGDLMVDQLSPNELQSVLWALAVHGERETVPQSRFEIELAETAAALKKIAFDRIILWLQKDTQTLTAFSASVNKTSQMNRDEQDHVLKEAEEFLSGLLVEEDDMTVDEGFAVQTSFLRKESSEEQLTDEKMAPFLTGPATYDTESAADSAAPSTAEKTALREADLRKLPQSRGTGDADVSLLSVSSDVAGKGSIAPDSGLLEPNVTNELHEFEANSDGAILNYNAETEEEDEIIEITEEAKNGSSVSVPSCEREENSLIESTIPSIVATNSNLIFGSSELCSIAWAVSELNDSIRVSVIKEITRNIFLRGPQSLIGRSGNALANLAQAISKVVVEGGDLDNIQGSHTVLEWIAAAAYRSIIGDAGVEQDAVKRSLHRFHPPLLSRLVFALAAAKCSMTEGKPSESKMGLVTLALEASSEHQDVFGTEDLACVAFAYLELVLPYLPKSERPAAEFKLGRMIAAIELALLQWERGSYPVPHGSSDPASDNKDIQRFKSFFGKSWSHAAKMDLRVDDAVEDIDEFEGSAVPSLLTEKVRLPSLKDFPVDPSTLSRLTWSSSRLSSGPHPTASDTLARVALRLFTSRNGRLIRECQAFDLASIARAASSSSQQEIVSVFTRRLVSVLNESPTLLINSPPVHLVGLLFSLGRLGVKYNPAQEPGANHHRRLQLVSSLPNLQRHELDSLPFPILTLLLRAIGTLDIPDHDADFAKDTLDAIERRLSSNRVSGAFLKGLVEGLGDLVELTDRKALVVVGTLGESNNVTSTHTPQTYGASLDILKISQRCKGLLIELANTVLMKELANLSTSDLRKVIQVYATLPLTVDDFIQAVEANIETRKRRLLMESEIPSDPSALLLLSPQIANPDSVQDRQEDPDKDDAESSAHSTETGFDMVHWYPEVVENPERKKPNDQGSVLVELGRCQELISHYRRSTDFASGILNDPLVDQERRRDMSKRILSDRL